MSSQLKIKESELKDILAEVASDLAKAFEPAADELKKADGDAPPEESSGGDAGGPPAEGSESAPPDASASGAPPADASGPPAPGPDAAPSPDGVDPAAEQAAQVTPEQIQAEYLKLSPEELDIHIKAALAAKAALAGAGAPDAGGVPPPAAGPDASAAPMPDASASAAPPAPAGPPVPPPPAGPPAFKSELASSPERGGKDSIDSVAKSEPKLQTVVVNDEISRLQALVKSQGEDIANLAKIAQSLAERPLRKAVTTVAHMPKAPEAKRSITELNRATITAHLKTLTASPDLKKSDRQLISDFYDGRVQISALAPLFEDFK